MPAAFAPATVQDLHTGATYLINDFKGRYIAHVTVDTVIDETVFMKDGTARTFSCYKWEAVLRTTDSNE